MGSLNVRVKKTTEAFSHFLGVGSSSSNSSSNTNLSRVPLNVRTSAPPNSSYFEKIHKNWGSADNIPHDNNTMTSSMPPPKFGAVKKHRSKRAAGGAEFGTPNLSTRQSQSQSVPSTPNQARAPIGSMVSENPKPNLTGDSDSDSAYGFDSNWNPSDGPQRPTYI